MSGLPPQLSALLRSEAYPHPVESVQLVETHVSWVLLTGPIAYKIKRPVQYDFVDLRSQERRAFFCREELRLNKRFAPQLYLDVCEIRMGARGATIGGKGEIIEHAVRMVQFPPEEGLDRLLESGAVEPAALEVFGRDLVELHSQLRTATAQASWGTFDAIRSAMIENLRQCAAAAKIFGLTESFSPFRELLEQRIAIVEALIRARLECGRVRECHGDLHAGNVVRYESRLIAFDGLEFDPAFRWIDVAEEVAFLFVDLLSRNRSLHAVAFLNGYLESSGDFAACRILGLYMAHRALVRAKVHALAAAGSNDKATIERSYALFSSYTASARHALAAPQGRLMLISGLSGSGKTWLARQLAPELQALHVRSDIERKRAAGIQPLASSRSPLREGLYSPDETDRVYQRLVDIADAVMSGGFTALVDATFLQRSHRAHFQMLAAKHGMRAILLQCHAPDEILEKRIQHREQSGADASEAGLAVLKWQQQRIEAIDPLEGFDVVPIDTTQPDPVLTAIAAVRRQGGGLASP